MYVIISDVSAEEYYFVCSTVFHYVDYVMENFAFQHRYNYKNVFAPNIFSVMKKEIVAFN